jgi:hypothetical protein
MRSGISRSPYASAHALKSSLGVFYALLARLKVHWARPTDFSSRKPRKDRLGKKLKENSLFCRGASNRKQVIDAFGRMCLLLLISNDPVDRFDKNMQLFVCRLLRFP